MVVGLAGLILCIYIPSTVQYPHKVCYDLLDQTFIRLHIVKIPIIVFKYILFKCHANKDAEFCFRHWQMLPLWNKYHSLGMLPGTGNGHTENR